MKKQTIMKILIVIVVLAIVGILLSILIPAIEQKKADAMYEKSCAQLQQFPDYENSENYVVSYFRGETCEYMYVQRDGKRIIGKRSEGSDTTYWYYDHFTEPGQEAAEVVQAIRDMAEHHLSQENVTCTYVKRGFEAHIYVPVDAPDYVILHRQGEDSANYQEIMNYYEDSRGAHASWGKYAYDTHEDIFFIDISGIPINYGKTYVPGWGALPEDFTNGDMEKGEAVYVTPDGFVREQAYSCEADQVASAQIVRLDKFIKGIDEEEYRVLCEIEDPTGFIARLNDLECSVNWDEPEQMKIGSVVIRIDYHNGDYDYLSPDAQIYHRSGQKNRYGYLYFDEEQFTALISDYWTESA